MTDARRLRPRRVTPTPSRSGEQCSVHWTHLNATNHNIDWRRGYYPAKGLDPEHCTFSGDVEIGGRRYCTRHAGAVALAILLGEEMPYGDAG